MSPLFFAVGTFAILVSLGLLFFEMHLRSQRTQVFQVPGGLNFVAQKFSVQFLRTQKEVRVQCAHGVLRSAGAGASPKPGSVGRAQCTFAAVGFRAEVRESVTRTPDQTVPVLTGYSEISLQAADDTGLTIQHVNAAVAADFFAFYRQVNHWIEKLEQRLERERVTRLRAQDDATQTQRLAELMAQLATPVDVPPSPAHCEAVSAAQIALWRRAAGFHGQHSAWQADAKGLVLWFVDLAADGRITLCADKRTLHGTLQGASIAFVGDDLQVGLRDAYWTEQEPELRNFRLLRGRGSEERRVWKERLEVIKNGLALRTEQDTP